MTTQDAPQDNNEPGLGYHKDVKQLAAAALRHHVHVLNYNMADALVTTLFPDLSHDLHADVVLRVLTSDTYVSPQWFDDDE